MIRRFNTTGPCVRTEQLEGCLGTLGCCEGWLLLFDPESSARWESRLTWETIERRGRTLRIVGV
jgi:hypothetical protein